MHLNAGIYKNILAHNKSEKSCVNDAKAIADSGNINHEFCKTNHETTLVLNLFTDYFTIFEIAGLPQK